MSRKRKKVELIYSNNKPSHIGTIENYYNNNNYTTIPLKSFYIPSNKNPSSRNNYWLTFDQNKYYPIAILGLYYSY